MSCRFGIGGIKNCGAQVWVINLVTRKQSKDSVPLRCRTRCKVVELTSRYSWMTCLSSDLPRYSSHAGPVFTTLEIRPKYPAVRKPALMLEPCLRL